ncbi:MAG: LCP family protein [Patescibacteria group bacterium]|nr:LCP family protein [Patescibacteria group bacterium]
MKKILSSNEPSSNKLGTASKNSSGSSASDTSSNMKKDKSKNRHIIIKSVAAIFIVLIVVAGFFGYRTYKTLNKVIVKNSGPRAEGLKTENVAVEKLKGEGDGRVNILLLGVGDPGHAGEELSDTMIVASYDPKTKDVAMLSIPRDLYVKVPNNGYSKINSAHAFGEQYKEGTGPDLAKKTVSEVLGIPIHYYIRTDFTALKQAVDTVGGVDIDVLSTLIDPDYPCEKNEGKVCGFSILAGPQHFNGSSALKYARCRKGNCGDDYGRAKRQQDVLVALRQKATKLNILANPAKVVEILDIVGKNVRTDLQVWEIERLTQVARDTDPSKITSKVLDIDTTGLVKNSQVGAASVVVPVAGIGNYSAIQAFVRSIFVDGYIKQEAATIQVENGTAQLNKAQLVSELLKSYNYNVISVVPADATTYKKTQIIDSSKGSKPYTIQYLEKRFGVKATPAAQDSAEQKPAVADVRIIVGTDYKTF